MKLVYQPAIYCRYWEKERRREKSLFTKNSQSSHNNNNNRIYNNYSLSKSHRMSFFWYYHEKQDKHRRMRKSLNIKIFFLFFFLHFLYKWLYNNYWKYFVLACVQNRNRRQIYSYRKTSASFFGIVNKRYMLFKIKNVFWRYKKNVMKYFCTWRFFHHRMTIENRLLKWV